MVSNLHNHAYSYIMALAISNLVIVDLGCSEMLAILICITVCFVCVCVLAFSANGKDVIVDFPQQSHWTGLLSEMELVPSVHPGVRYSLVPNQPHFFRSLGA